MARAIPRRFFLQSLVACKSTSASESIQTEFELNKSDVFNSLRGPTFAASKRGSFFQEAPRLRNQFSGDLILQSYLKRIIPNEVELLFDIVQLDRYGLFIQYKSVSVFLRYDSRTGLERAMEVCLCKGQHNKRVSILKVWDRFLNGVQIGGHVSSPQFFPAWYWVNGYSCLITDY